jgi:hypothetical protein
MALILFLLGWIGITISLILWYENFSSKLQLIFMLPSLVLIAITFLGNTSHIDKHVVFRSDSFQGVTYSKVVKIKYDILKPDHCWTWNNFSSNDIENIHISFEE